MKTIGIVTVRADAGRFLKAQLDKLSADMVKVNLYVLSEIKDPLTLTEEAFLIFPGPDALNTSRHKLKYSCEWIIANRSVNYHLLDEVFRIPAGEEVFVLNDFEAATTQSIQYLQELGINHIQYIPLFPGAEVDEKCRTLITFGEYDYMPPNPKKIIDLGIRTIDISTIVEILLKLNMPQHTIETFTTRYVRDIITLTNEINSLNNHNEYMKNKLKTIIQAVRDGILTLDKDNKISVLNKAAEQILGCKGSAFIGKDIRKLEDKISAKFLSEIPESMDSGGIFDLGEKKLVINHSKIVHNQNNIEKVIIIREVTEIQKLEQKLRMKISSKRYTAKYTFDHILGDSEVIKKQKEMACKIARFDSPVYIYGESGTGKELFAQAIHLSSSRKNGPFVAVNFAAMSESLLESELFGYAEGAFTGAKKGGMPGVFEQAHGGTLFLDEIGDAPLSFQIKLLRVLQEKQVRRIGDDKLIPVDVRVIVATNKNIPKLVEEGKFREDLYYRINVLPLRLPPLRERKEDIYCMAKAFYEEMVSPDRMTHKDFDTFFKAVRPAIESYDFPGNARQLKNIIEYLVCTCENGIAYKELLPLDFWEPEKKSAIPAPISNDMEMQCLAEIYRRSVSGFSSGRRSLALALHCSEQKMKKIISFLEKHGYIVVSRGRKGICLTSEGVEKVLNGH